MDMRWIYAEPSQKTVRQLQEQLHISSLLARTLVNRGITDSTDAKHFLYDNMSSLYDPFLMKDVRKGAERILTAIERGERIVVYGDYDVDGITSTALVYRSLCDLGADPAFYIPERQSEGYGLNRDALEELVHDKTEVIITVDCGISSSKLVKEFNTQTDIIITDHHEPSEHIPEGYAVINPKQQDCMYPYKELAGVGVAYTLCRALRMLAGKTGGEEYTSLVALGTVADLVPLTGENRILVADGLSRIAEGDNCGIQALIETTGLDATKISAGNIAFSVAPRLNAAGRISHAEKGVFLLLEKDSDKAKETAEELHDLNTQRQDIERAITTAAIDEVESEGYEDDHVLVVAGDGWHSGVIGIAASRLIEKYYKPSLVISLKDGVGKGSCRSITGFNMYEALNSCKELLIQFGGHAMAAGFSVAQENIDALREQLNEYALRHLTEKDYIPVLNVDSVVAGEDITVDTVHELSLLEPYGMGNTRPLFVLKNALLYDIKEIGRQKTHLRIVAESEDGCRLSGVGWSMADKADYILRNDEVDLAFQPELNTYHDRTTAQLVLRDMRLTHEYKPTLTRNDMVDIYKVLKTYVGEGRRTVSDTRRYMLDAVTLIDGHDVLTALQVFKELGILVTASDDEDIYYEMPTQGSKLSLNDSPTFRAVGSGL